MASPSRTMQAIRVMLVDDHPLWRDTLRKVLEHAGCTVVATASNGDEAIMAAQETHPDVVVMDVNLPGTDGIAATKRLAETDPDARVLALSSSDEPASVVGIVRAGASGYLVKTAGGAEVSDAVHRVHAGELVFPPELAGLVLAELRRTDSPVVESIRVVVADGTALNREGLGRLLSDAGLEVAGLAEDAESLEQSIAAADPDVAVIDIGIAGRNIRGRQLVKEIRDRHPQVAVLVMAADVRSAQALKLMTEASSGIGVLLKDRIAKVDQVVEAIARVRAGETVVDPDIVERLVERPGDRTSVGALTPREREVLGLMAEGRSNQAICERLFLNPKSIESHVRNIFTKLGLEPAPDDHRRVLAVLTFLRDRDPSANA